MSDLFHERCDDDYIHRVFEVMHDIEGNMWQLPTKRSERYVEMDPYLPWAENIWAGTLASPQDSKDRLDFLQECNAEVTFASIEPIIENLGGESGPVDEIRELNPDWMWSIIRQCREQDTAVFLKQMGEIWARADNGYETDHPHGGHPYDWPEDLQIREVPRIYSDQPELDPWP